MSHHSLSWWVGVARAEWAARYLRQARRMNAEPHRPTFAHETAREWLTNAEARRAVRGASTSDP
jgi:hypothetical protein